MIKRQRSIWFVLAIALSVTPICSSQTDADWEWVSDNFGGVLDNLMPLQQSGLHVVYRAHRDYRTDVPEYWFTIGYDFGSGRLSAHVRLADTSSIYDQLMRMHRSDPKEDASSMVKKIRVKDWRVDDASCPLIREQIDRFQDVKYTPFKLETHRIILHPMNHEFRLEAPDGTMNLIIWDDEHPLVRWAHETRLTLERCAQTK